MTASGPLLPADQVREITGRARPREQVARLKELGFLMAWHDQINRRACCPVAHYIAVCEGRYGQQPPARPEPALDMAAFQAVRQQHSRPARAR